MNPVFKTMPLSPGGIGAIKLAKTMIANIIKMYDFNLAWANRLVEDLDENQMKVTPATGLENHPAFTLGHLVTGSALLAASLGATKEMPEGWAELFQRKGPGDPRLPSADPDSYPSKDTLLSELERQHNKVKEYLVVFDPQKLSEPIAWRFKQYLPTYFDLINFMCISHESMHLGQLSAWRRGMSLPSALAKL
jgi:hypothetical protein